MGKRKSVQAARMPKRHASPLESVWSDHWSGVSERAVNTAAPERVALALEI